MIIKAVLDTNVVVSANLVDEGPSAAILDLAINKAILMVVSPPVLEEYEKVLHRPRLKLDPAQVAAVMALIRKNGVLVHPTVRETSAKGDESDNRFLECPAPPRQTTSSPATPSTSPNFLNSPALSRPDNSSTSFCLPWPSRTPNNFLGLLSPAPLPAYTKRQTQGKPRLRFLAHGFCIVAAP